MSANGQSVVSASRNDSRKLIMQLDLLVASKIEAIAPVVRKLMRLLKKTCCLPAQDFAVETVLREALANAILHGNRLDAGKKVRVCCACDSTWGIQIMVKDEGEGFDPASIASPVVAQNIYADHGRGIFLIKTLMDEVHFENGGREIHMRLGGMAPRQAPANGSDADDRGIAGRERNQAGWRETE